MKLLTELDSLDNVKDGETRKLITKTSTSGSGNVVSSVGVSGDTITYTKGVTALTAHQKAYSTMKVGNTDVAATQAGDTFNIVAGSNVTLTPDATNKKVTIAATDTTYESKAAASGGTAVSLVTTGEKYTWNNKQNALSSQTAYSAKGTATKVPQITTNTLGQVTKIEEVTITQPTVNNATLTIQKNGTTVKTFTANASTDVTANITVPTKTSDITNDSGFITSHQNTFSNVKVGSTTVAADAAGDTLELVAGNNITLTPDATNDKVTIAASQPTVNNGTLTIQKNGTNVQTFSANQSSNATANITVPTKTSDLTNDSNYITNTGSTSGNAGTATKLQTARKINTIDFDGSADITVPYLGRVDTRNKMYPSDLKTAYITTGFSSKGGIDNGTNNSEFVDFIGFNSWDNNSGGKENLLFMPKTGNAAIYHYVGDFGANSWSTKKQLAYTDSNITGNAASATKLQTARTIAIGTGATGTATSFDGSSNITIPITDMKESYVTWGGKAMTTISPDDMGCIDEFGHNKLAYLPADCIKVEYTTDGGSTWLDYGLTDTQKIALTTTTGTACAIGKGTVSATAGTLTNENCGNYQVRVTISTRRAGATSGVLYTASKKWLINFSTNGAGGCKVKMEYRTIANYNAGNDTWVTQGTYDISGWSGWNSYPASSPFGGGTNQTGQIADYRFTATISSVNTSYSCQAQFIDFRLIGGTNWSMPSELARAGHLYTIDTAQNATFPADVKGATVTSTGTLTAGSITTTGNITASSGDILLTKNATSGGQQVKWSTAANDYARIYGAATASNAGYLEIATADDANEPIYARQYSGNFGTLTRTATLLDASGNTSFPGTLTANKIDATKLDGAIPSSVTATTQTQGDNSTKLATTAYVDTALNNLPEPMVFKGSLGTGGTITSLPTAAASNEGWTYKVITAGTYASQSAKVGDTFISDGSAWVLIPSGDEPSGTVTSITIKGSSPITVDSESAITSSGTRTISHANSGVSAGTYKSVTVNATGHVTAGTNPTTLSGYGITDAKIASGVITLGSNTITPLTANSTLDATKVSGTLPTSTYTDTKYTAGTGLTLDGTQFKVTSANVSTMINLLDTGSSELTANDYVITQYVNGGTTTTSYHRRPANKVVNATLVKAALGTDGSTTTQFLSKAGSWQSVSTTDTKNTAGATDTSSKIFLVGATSQAANPQTYSDNEVYVTSGVLTTKSVQVGGTAATMQYNSTDKCIEFVFA